MTTVAAGLGALLCTAHVVWAGAVWRAYLDLDWSTVPETAILGEEDRDKVHRLVCGGIAGYAGVHACIGWALFVTAAGG